MELFFDTEFTGLYQNTTLISLGIISLDGRYFYAEFNDYDESQVNDWIQENVINNLLFNDTDMYCTEEQAFLPPYDNLCSSELHESYHTMLKGDKDSIVRDLKYWLQQFPTGEDIIIWSDCLSYDWVLFNELFGGAQNIPPNINYIPLDICTAFKIKGIDPDISREEFIGYKIDGNKHNSLYDAKVIRECYFKLFE